MVWGKARLSGQEGEPKNEVSRLPLQTPHLLGSTPALFILVCSLLSKGRRAQEETQRKDWGGFYLIERKDVLGLVGV